MNVHGQRIWLAIQNTIALNPPYWRSVLERRTIRPGAGGRYDDNMTPYKLESRVLGAAWRPYCHQSINPKRTSFRASIGGLLPAIPVSAIADMEVCLMNFHSVNSDEWTLMAFVPQEHRPRVEFSTIILGSQQGKEVVYKLLPGEPVIYPYTIPEKAIANSGFAGELATRPRIEQGGATRVNLSAAEVRDLGLYTWAKIASNC